MRNKNPLAPLKKHLRSVLDRIQRTRFGRHVTRKNAPFLGGITLGCFFALYGLVFYWPRSAALSFAHETCITNPALFPNLVSSKGGGSYQAQPRTSLKIANYPLYSHQTCVSPTQAPKENSVETIKFGSAVLKKNIKVTVGTFPALAQTDVLKGPVSTNSPLELTLESADTIFDYRLTAADKQLDCDTQDSKIICNVEDLKLKQSRNYTFKLERLYAESPVGTLFEQSMRTVENVRIIKATYEQGQLIHSKPTKLGFVLSRDAVRAEGVELINMSDKKHTRIPTTATFTKKKMTLMFKEQLPREADFMLKINRVAAEDGGMTPKPYSLSFRTSGGPKVLGVSIGSYKAPLAGGITISFDSPIKTSDAQKFVRLRAGNKQVQIQVQASGNVITLSPAAALPRCTPIVVSVLDGLKNKYGVSGGSVWQYNSRTICQNVFSIGTSVQGRSITAYSFGTGGTKIVFVGATHGDEMSSAYLLNQWIEALEARGVPANKTIVVIPALNPDGYAAGRRTNAHNVDLNRNFPANDWKSGVTMPNQTYNPKGGGSRPLSEPESAAVANYILGLRPRLVLTYHAVAGTVIPNGSGDSSAIASVYDQKSNVYYSNTSEADSIFQYDTTGAMEDWLRDRVGIPALLVELWTMSGGEFSSHQDAMWAMVNL